MHNTSLRDFEPAGTPTSGILYRTNTLFFLLMSVYKYTFQDCIIYQQYHPLKIIRCTLR